MSDTAETLAARFARRFPVRSSGDAGTFTWHRGDRDPLYRFEPHSSFRGGRRNDGTSWCMWAYHAALGDVVTLSTIVPGQPRMYVLKATPDEARGYLEWNATRPGFNLGRGTAREWLAVLDKATTVVEEA